MRLVQAKMSDEAVTSYRRLPVFCNEPLEGRLDGVLPEPSPCQIARGLRARAAARDHSSRPNNLGLQDLHRGCDEVTVDAARLEIGADQRVARSPRRQELGPPAREALVVHRAYVDEPRDGLAPIGGRDAAPRQLVVEAPLGEIPPRDQSRCLRQGLARAQLTAKQAKARTVELEPDVEPGGEH